jgi:hypothetical protein
MLRDRRQLLTLVALVILMAAAAWIWFGPSAQTPAAVAAGVAVRGGAAGQEATLPAAAAVRLSALESPRAQPSEAVRNPFRFERRAAPEAQKPANPSESVAVQPAEPAAPAGPIGPPPMPLKFIGLVEKVDGTRWAVLALGEGRTMHGVEGAIIDGRYRIIKIGIESVDMAYLDGLGRQTIRLTGQ